MVEVNKVQVSMVLNKRSRYVCVSLGGSLQE